MQVVPSARRIAVLADPRSTQPADLKALENAARSRGVELVIFTAGVPEEITPAMDKANASGATALNVLSSALFSARVLHHVLLVAAVAPLLALAFPLPRAPSLPLAVLVGTNAVILWLWHAPGPCWSTFSQSAS